MPKQLFTLIIALISCYSIGIAADDAPVLSFENDGTNFYVHKLWSVTTPDKTETELQSVVYKDNIIYIPANPQADGSHIKLHRFSAITGEALDDIELQFTAAQLKKGWFDKYSDFALTKDEDDNLIGFFPWDTEDDSSYAYQRNYIIDVVKIEVDGECSGHKQYKIKSPYTEVYYWRKLGLPVVSGVFGDEEFGAYFPFTIATGQYVTKGLVFIEKGWDTLTERDEIVSLYNGVDYPLHISIYRINDDNIIVDHEKCPLRIYPRTSTSSALEGTDTSNGFNLVKFADRYFALYGGDSRDDYKLGIWKTEDLEELGTPIHSLSTDVSTKAIPAATILSKLETVGSISTGMTSKNIYADIWHLSAMARYNVYGKDIINMFLYQPGYGLSAYQLSTYDTVTSVGTVRAINNDENSATIHGREVAFETSTDAEVYDTLGRLVLSAHHVDNLSLSTLTSGIYILRYESSAMKVILQ
jgi:hypothetical protein